jgi:pimeloyl-ACP methyl ester carboxylesterase
VKESLLKAFFHQTRLKPARKPELMMLEKIVNVNDVDIAYQLHGNNQNPTIMLIHGVGYPLTAWPKAMIEQFVDLGFQVLLFDNRDVGRSGKFEHLSLPNLVWVMLKLKLGFSIKVPYQLEDMMLDTVALLDILKLEKVHLVGVSMGGMIAQLLTIHHPERVNSLTSIMSTTGNKTLPKMSDKIRKNLMSKPISDSDEHMLDFHIKRWQAFGSLDYPAELTSLTEYVKSILERGVTDNGTLRQWLAIMAAGNREEYLAKVNTPSLIIHGEADELVPVECGKATAMAIPLAKLKVYAGMGHDLPNELIPNIVQEIVDHAQEKVEVLTKEDIKTS